MVASGMWVPLHVVVLAALVGSAAGQAGGVGFNGCFDMGVQADQKKQADLFATAFNFQCQGPSCTKYTTRTCTGNFSKNRACRMRNLYYNVAEKQFEYYSCPTDMPTPVIIGHRKTSVNFQMDPVAGDTPWEDGHFEESFLTISRYERGPKFVRKFEPPPHASSVYSVPGLSVLWSGNKAGAFGHFWIDNIYPMLLMMSNFETLTHDFTLFFQPESGDTSFVATMQTYFPAISSNPVYIWDKFLDTVGTTHIRFDDMLMGNAFYGLNTILDNRDKSIQPTYVMSRFWWQLREHVYTGMQMNPNARPAAHKIVVNGYSAKRAIANAEELVQDLRTRFTGADVSVVDFASLTFQQQLNLLSSTTLFITTEGGPGYRHIFLPEGSGAIIIASPSTSNAMKQRFSAFHELDRFFGVLSYVTFYQYPVSSHDTDEFVERYKPGQELLNSMPKDNLRRFNMYNADVKVDLERMAKLVQMALFDINLQRAYGL